MAKRKSTPDASTTSGAEVKAQRRLGRGTWKVMDTSSSVLAAALAPRVSNLAWRAITGRKAPASSRHPDLSTAEAIGWAALGGATVQVVRTVVRRGVASYWVKSTGDLPPGMKKLAETGRPAPKDRSSMSPRR
ncbi:DUF4235 domain-containing protein [Aeromicrobium camelliae]|uniref:DUF4235 domain-containing protein n=1 Tax=Aeromicrobium camelliae TaxID=1538144 RepID=A0A3N6WM35_9ACTN|nr:DUF4235 domain-containing protein [Aeromicrobium camelliae]RQN08499.1 DUF4235 domain-containing protein [Aeromicrobium camelliae]